MSLQATTVRMPAKIAMVASREITMHLEKERVRARGDASHPRQ
jgi:hypothetical protein